MSKDRLLSVLIASESTKNKDHDADRANINKTIREIRKKNHDKDKILRDFNLTFDLEKDHYEPKKIVSAFNINCIQYKSIGDIDKTLLPKNYLDVIRPYLSHIINNHKTQKE